MISAAINHVPEAHLADEKYYRKMSQIHSSSWSKLISCFKISLFLLSTQLILQFSNASQTHALKSAFVHRNNNVPNSAIFQNPPGVLHSYQHQRIQTIQTRPLPSSLYSTVENPEIEDIDISSTSLQSSAKTYSHDVKTTDSKHHDDKKLLDLNLLIIDNFDSYTYNLYQYFAEICVKSPTVITNNDFDAYNKIKMQENLDAIIISPGPGNPTHALDVGVCKNVSTTLIFGTLYLL